jgi:hypothetical protein
VFLPHLNLLPWDWHRESDFLEAGYKNNKLTECNSVERYVAQEDLLSVFGNMIITQAVLKFPYLHGTQSFTAFS